MDGWVTNLLFGVAMFLLLGLSIGLQIFRTRRAPLGRVVALLKAIKHNQKLVEDFSYSRDIAKFKTGSWERYREKLVFLPQELRKEMTRLCDIVIDINTRIDEARRHQSDSYMAAIEVDKLKAPMDNCRMQLEEWIMANMNNPDYLPKKRSLFKR